MGPVIDADRAGSEPARYPGTAARLEPGKPDPRPPPPPGPAGRPLLQAAGQRAQPRVVGLLRVLRPPRRQLILVQVPPAPQRRQCPRHLGQLLFGNTVGTFGCVLVQAPPDMRQSLVECLARRPAVRGQHARLRRRRVQRKPVCPQHHLDRRVHAGLLRRCHRTQRPVPGTAAAVQAGAHRGEHLGHVPYKVVGGLAWVGNQHPPTLRGQRRVEVPPGPGSPGTRPGARPAPGRGAGVSPPRPPTGR